MKSIRTLKTGNKGQPKRGDWFLVLFFKNGYHLPTPLRDGGEKFKSFTVVTSGKRFDTLIGKS